MNIKINEFKKVITSPVIVGLLILFLIFNATLILQNSYIRDELQVLNNIVGKFGYKINDKMKIEMKGYHKEGLEKLNRIVGKKELNKYSNVSDLYDDHIYGIEGNYNKEEVEFINELAILEAYYYQALEIDHIYSNYNIIEKAEGEINKNELKGKPADLVRNQYKYLDKRFDELVANKEHKNLFFMGNAYKMHSMLFRSLFKTIIFEMIILVVLVTSYLINYEFANNTESITYTTKKGRNLILDKLYVAIFSNILISTVILGITLGLYFMIFNYSGIWNVPISSYFNTEYNFLYISWWNMSFLEYLFSSIGLIYVSVLIFTGIAFIISKLIKNDYIVFFVFAIVFGLFLLIPGWGPSDSNIIFVGIFTPFALIMYPHLWFMESGALTSFKYYELTTVGIWEVLLLILSIFSIKRFKKQDI